MIEFPTDKSEVMFWLGATLAASGLVLASPLDEAVVTAGTGGLGGLVAPAQGVATFGLGSLAILGGTALMVSSAWVD